MTKLIENSDFDFIYNLYMHPKVNPFLLYEKMSEKEFRPIFEELVSRNIVYVFYQNGEPVGMFKLVQNEYRLSHVAYIGGVGIHPNFGGKGYGSLLFDAIIEISNQKGYKRLELTVYTENHRAIALYTKHGFEKEGVLRNFGFLKSENRFIDEQMMALLL